MRPHFTVVIPTRNRLGTLKYALRTCLEQSYDELSVIVASNNCSDGTSEFLAALGAPRVVEIAARSDLNMTQNWSRVMAPAIERGGYITYLGDDDGLLPGALDLAAKLIQRHRCGVLSWRKAEYVWPDAVVENYRNYFWMSIRSGVELRKSEEFLSGVHDFSVGYDEGPGIYSSFISAEVLQRLQISADEDWFAGCSPDVYSAYAIAAGVPDYIRCRFALSVNGGSGASNGLAYMHAPLSGAAASFRRESPIHEPLVHAPCVAIAEADALLVARDRFPSYFQRYQFSWTALRGRIGAAMASAPSREHYELLAEAFARVESMAGGLAVAPPPFAAPAPIEVSIGQAPLSPGSGSFCGLLDERLVDNVFDASLLASCLLPLSRIEDLEVVDERASAEHRGSPCRGAPSTSLPMRLKRRAKRLVQLLRRGMPAHDD